MSLFDELKRRNVIRVAMAYVVAAWLVIQVVETILPAFGYSDVAIRYIVIVLAIAFIPTMVFSWAFEITPEGLKREVDVVRETSITRFTSKKLDQIIMVLLALAVGYFAFDKFVLDPAEDVQIAESAHQEGRTEALTESYGDKSIAVLPFVNMSVDPHQEYFSDGISEELLNLLSKFPEMRVISRSSAFSFKNKDVDIPTIASQLNVTHILEGSVRKAGSKVRITVQLIDARSDTHLWSESYDRELDGIFAVQEEIASAVIGALQIILLGDSPKVTKTDPQAYALYLQGRFLANHRTKASFKQAEALLNQALAIDSGFAPAWTELAAVLGSQAGYGFRPYDEGFKLARKAALQAIVIDPRYARGYSSLSRVERQYDWNFVSAYQHSQHALTLDSGDAWVLNNAASLNTRLGRFDDAINLYRRSIAIDPVSSNPHQFLGRALYYAGRLDEAAASVRKALSLTPGTVGGQYFLGWVLLAQGDTKRALEAMKREPQETYRLTGITVIQHALNNAEASDAALKELIENWEAGSYYQIALAFAYRGDISTSFDWLQRAYDNHDSGLNKMLVDPLLANLHDDPRWEPFLDKMGLQD